MRKTLGLLVAIATLLVGQPHLAAVTMGTAFTYQGRFMDGGSAANGSYDFEFELYDALTSGTQQGSTVYEGDVDVNDGYFTVALDFGGTVFDGDARWLEIGVRPGDETGSYTTLTPRHELTPTAYAQYAERTAGISVSNDNVGIGTTSPVSALHVQQGDITIGQSGATPQEILFESNYPDAHIAYQGVDAHHGWLTVGVNKDGETSTYDSLRMLMVSRSAGNLGYIAFQHADESATPSFTELARITNTGDVGIGTTVPGKKLDVDGDIRLRGDTATLTFRRNTSATDIAYLQYSNAYSRLDIAANNKDIRFVNGLGWVENMRITETGCVGVQTAVPVEVLDVAGRVRCVDVIETSDERLKTDIQPLSGVLDKLGQVRAVSFEWNEKAQSMGAEADTRQIGVLAQEVEQVFPELVTTVDPSVLDKLLEDYPEEALTAEEKERRQADIERAQYKAVSYSKLTAVLLEAVKELQERNESLEQRIRALESKAQ